MPFMAKKITKMNTDRQVANNNCPLRACTLLQFLLCSPIFCFFLGARGGEGSLQCPKSDRCGCINYQGSILERARTDWVDTYSFRVIRCSPGILPHQSPTHTHTHTEYTPTPTLPSSSTHPHRGQSADSPKTADSPCSISLSYHTCLRISSGPPDLVSSYCVP